MLILSFIMLSVVWETMIHNVVHNIFETLSVDMIIII